MSKAATCHVPSGLAYLQSEVRIGAIELLILYVGIRGGYVQQNFYDCWMKIWSAPVI